MNIKNKIKNRLIIFWQFNIQAVLVRVLNAILPRTSINAIVIESHDDFDGNGGAFYDYLVKNRYNEKHKIVLFLHHRLDREIPNGVVAYQMYRPSILRAYYSCRAKFLFADNNAHKKMMKEQISVYMTHGPVPFKNTNGIIVLPQSTDFCLSPSSFYDEYQKRAFTIHSPHTVMLHLGFPCLDDLFNDTESALNKIVNKNYKKSVIWMPTFRVGGRKKRSDVDYNIKLGIPLITNINQYNQLNDYLAGLNMLLVIKLHPKQDLSSLKVSSRTNIVVLTNKDMKEKNISNYKLYKDMDAMISDYSTSSFDFMNLDRPICYDFSDFEHYKLGLIMDNPDDFMPGEKIYDYGGLIDFLNKVDRGIDLYSAKRMELINRLFEHHDGNSCKRIAEYFNI